MGPRARLRDRGQQLPTWVAPVLAVAAFAAVAAWLTVSTWRNVSESRLDVGMLTDFRDAIYYPLRALFDGVNPYDAPAYYGHYPVGQEFPLWSPVHFVVHAPVLLLPFEESRAAYFGVTLLLILVLAWCSIRLAGHRVSVATVFGLGALLLLTEPGKLDLRAGQPAAIIILGCYLALASSERRWPAGAAGVALAFIKPTFGIVLVVLLICRRQVRAAIAGLGATVAVSIAFALPLADAAGGFGNLIDTLRTNLDVTSRSPQSRLGSSLRIDAASTLARFTGLRPSEAVGTVIGLAILAVGAALVWRLNRTVAGSNRSELAVTLACLIVLTSTFHVPYDLLLLTWPVLMLVRRTPPDVPAWSRRVRTAVLVLVLVPIVDPLSWSAVNNSLGAAPGAKRLLGVTAQGLCLIVALGLTAWSAWRATQDAASTSRAARSPDWTAPSM
jgi:hypothetical protein